MPVYVVHALISLYVVAFSDRISYARHDMLARVQGHFATSALLNDKALNSIKVRLPVTTYPFGVE